MPYSAQAAMSATPNTSQRSNPHQMASGDTRTIPPNQNATMMSMLRMMVLNSEALAMPMDCSSADDMLMPANSTATTRRILATWIMSPRMPMVLSSLCFCAALLFHTVNDPFGILEWFRGFGIITIQLLMYLLPMHVFLLSLRFILPAQMRGGVDLARFVMYCITMLCLLLASFFFGNVTDAIVLAGFSFAILVGSFAVKRLRWFALGFVVLVVMTIRLTWSFWTSLHWGIYLFLAGILLIAMASLYEYRSRMAQEHPERKAEKPRLFKDWKM